MLRKKLGIECIELDWVEIFDSIYDYYKIPPTLIIPEGCERIGAAAFCGSLDLKKAIIPESVERIGDYAFWDCSRAIITLKKPVIEFKYVGSYAFDYCKDVKEETRN